MRMVEVLNQKLDGVGKVNCSTCHGEQVRPSRLPRPSLEAELGRWPAELADAPEAQKLAMTVYNVSLGVGCDHCHTAEWKNGEKKAMKTVALMSSLFEEFPKYMPPTARTQCYMCHKGSTNPQSSNSLGLGPALLQGPRPGASAGRRGSETQRQTRDDSSRRSWVQYGP